MTVMVPLRECVEVEGFTDKRVPDIGLKVHICGGQVFVYSDPLSKLEDYDGLVCVIEQANRKLQLCVYTPDMDDPVYIRRW